jgi:hypothetical protein
MPRLFEECDQCGGSGFDSPGTGYDNVCGKCGGLRFLPIRDEPQAGKVSAGTDDDDRRVEDDLNKVADEVANEGMTYRAARIRQGAIRLAFLRHSRTAAAGPQTPPAPQQTSEGKAMPELSASSACPICEQDTPHHHTPEEVEVHRVIRPAFEQWMQGQKGVKHGHREIAIWRDAEVAWIAFRDAWRLSSSSLTRPK